MVQIFNHWFSWRTIAQMIFDLSFVIVGMIIVAMWVGNDLPINAKHLVIFAVILGVTMLVINAWLGFYQRIHHRTVTESRARAVLSLYLAVPIAYGLFAMLPMATLSREFMQLSAMSAVFGMLINRVSVSHSSTVTTSITRRILVFGTGSQALGVKRALNKSDPAAEIVGFFPSPNEEAPVVPEMQILSRNKTLTDTAKALKVDEIVVALTERRGGSMPMRELLDCKLHGIRVLDLASHFEQTLGQIRLDSLYAGWLIFGDGFRQGTFRSVIKRLSDIIFLPAC
jgi:hypothetical protein